MQASTRRALARDKTIAFSGIGLLALLGADLVARGADSLYGLFFVWLVGVLA